MNAWCDHLWGHHLLFISLSFSLSTLNILFFTLLLKHLTLSAKLSETANVHTWNPSSHISPITSVRLAILVLCPWPVFQLRIVYLVKYSSTLCWQPSVYIDWVAVFLLTFIIMIFQRSTKMPPHRIPWFPDVVFCLYLVWWWSIFSWSPGPVFPDNSLLSFNLEFPSQQLWQLLWLLVESSSPDYCNLHSHTAHSQERRGAHQEWVIRCGHEAC